MNKLTCLDQLIYFYHMAVVYSAEGDWTRMGLITSNRSDTLVPPGLRAGIVV